MLQDLKKRFIALGFSSKAFDNIKSKDLNLIEQLIKDLEGKNE